MMPVDTATIELDQLASGAGERCPRCAEVVRADAQGPSHGTAAKVHTGLIEVNDSPLRSDEAAGTDEA
jgi:hypothetical protein